MKVKKIIRNPLILIAIAVIGSVPAFIYTFIYDVFSYSDFPLWALISACMIPAVIIWWFILFIEGLIKTMKNKK